MRRICEAASCLANPFLSLSSALSQSVIFLILCFLLLQPAILLAGTATLTPVTLQLKWKHQFQFAGYYAAIDKGYYRNVGLDVSLREAEQGVDPFTAVLNGDAQFGVGGSSLALARAEGKPVIALAAILQHSPLGILSRADSNIRNVHDLAGKRLMLEPKSAEAIALLKAEGVSTDMIRFVPHEFTLDKLLNGQVDAVSVYSTTETYLLKKRGIPFNLIFPERSGIDFYGDILFTTQEELRRHPDVVREFREASLRGWKYAVDHRDELIDIILERYNTNHLTRDQLVYEADEMQKLIRPELIEIGYMNSGRWQHIVATYSELGMIPASKAFPLKSFIYNSEKGQDLTWFYRTLIGILAVIVVISAVAFRFHRLNVALNNQMRLRDKAEEELRKLSAAVIQSPVSIVITDTNGSIEYVNPKFCELSGYSEEEVIGQNPRILRGSVLSQEFYAQLWQTILSGREWSGEFLNKKKNGELFWERATISPIWGANGELTNFIALKENITERKLLEDKLDYMAHYDELTALPNRALFFDRIGQAISYAKRNQSGIALMFVDLDGFKDINDTYGHDSGDMLLKEVARRLERCIRESDTVARVGGDEFTVMILDVVFVEHIAHIADKILETLAVPFKLKGDICHVGASIGISFFPQNGNAVDTLLNAADMAMYSVKQSNKNGYAFAAESSATEP